MNQFYSARDAAEIVGVDESRVRYWAQTGFIGPSARPDGRAAYTFEDLIGLKAAKALLDRGLTLQRARKSVAALRSKLPELRQPLAHLRVVVERDGGQLMVLAEGGAFEPISGQLLFDFDLETLAGQAAELHPPPTDSQTAYNWFCRAVELEAGDLGDAEPARSAYRRALELDPLLAAAHTNLGAIHHRTGNLGEARTSFEQALLLDPDQPEARHNLANLLDELGETEQAIAEWCRVLNSSPDFGDAHFNLSMALHRGGQTGRSRTHLERYLELDSTGEWAEQARNFL